MAKYDREFLVPYLQDICSLYLADRRLKQKIYTEQIRIENYKRKEYVPKPEKPEYEDTGLTIGCGCGGLFAIFAMLFGIAGLITILTGDLSKEFGNFFAAISVSILGVVVLVCCC